METGHRYYVGRSGSGKSTLMLTAMIEAIQAGDGVFYLDPHGTDTDTILEHIPPRRRNDVILFDPSQWIVSFNPLDRISDKNLSAEAILYALKDIWRFQDLSTPTFDEYVLHSLLTLLQNPNPTLLGVTCLLTSPRFRARQTSGLSDRHLRSFWADYEALTPKERRDEIRSTKNKLNVINADIRLRRTLGQARTALRMDEVLEGKICLCRLPQGAIGIEKVRLLGMLLLCQLHIAALGWTSDRPFHVFVDEFHHFQGKALMEMLSGVRKFGGTLHLSHQYLRQLTPAMRDAVIGNASIKHVFRVSKSDSEWLDEETRFDNTTPKFFELTKYAYRVDNEVFLVNKIPRPVFQSSRHRTTKCAVEKYARGVKKIDRELDRFFSAI